MRPEVTRTATDEDARFVFDEWHRATTNRDVDGLIALYTDDAVMETPMAVLLLGGRGELRGKAEVERFLRANFARRETVIASMAGVAARNMSGETVRTEPRFDLKRIVSRPSSTTVSINGRMLSSASIAMP